MLKKGSEDPQNAEYAAFLESVYGNEHLGMAFPKPPFLTAGTADAEDAYLSKLYDVMQLGEAVPRPSFLDLSPDAAPVYAQIMSRMTQDQIERHKTQENFINGGFLVLEERILKRRHLDAQDAWSRGMEYDLLKAREYPCISPGSALTTECTFDEYWQRSKAEGLMYWRTQAEDSQELRFMLECSRRDLFGRCVLEEIGIGKR